MYEITYDLTINEEKLLETSENMRQKLKYYQEYLWYLINLTDRILDESITDGRTAANLDILKNQIHLLKGETEEVYEKINTFSQQYLSGVEQAEAALYESLDI